MKKLILAAGLIAGLCAFAQASSVSVNLPGFSLNVNDGRYGRFEPYCAPCGGWMRSSRRHYPMMPPLPPPNHRRRPNGRRCR